MFKLYSVGEWVFDCEKGRYVQVVSSNELWGYKTYNVYDPIDKSLRLVADEVLRHYSQRSDFDIHYFKYIVISSRVFNELSNGILSPIGGSIIPLPHQIYALNRVLSDSKVRYLLADEVGLGKTIEAGLIIKELKARGFIKRILIISPKGLINQWHDEMKNKFDENFNILLPQDFDAIKRLYGDGNVWRKFDQVITSIDSVKPLEKRQRWTEEDIEKYNKERIEDLAAAGWDIIIADEAHRIAGSSSDVARYKLGKVLADASPYLLLLTATPHQGKTDSFLRLVRLLDKNAFPDENAIVREQVAPYIVRTEKREALDSEGNLLFKNRITKTKNISWSVRHSLQKELYEKVTEYVSKGYNLARREKKNYIGFLMVLMQRLVTSSTHAIKENLERRIEILKNSGTSSNNFDEDDFYEYDAQEALDELIKIKYQDIKKEQREVEDLLHLAERAESQYVDVKAETLLEDLDLLQMEHSEKPKVIIFTEFIATQEFLQNFLQEKGYSVAILNGTMSIEERNDAIDIFKKSADILVSTDAGGEGLNLQFCNIMINYDLPWNPMKIEQRIGRIDRIGQKRDVVAINYVLSDTIEFRVRQVLEEKLKIIFEQFGVDKMQDILDSVQSEMDFTDLYMKSIENPDDIDFRVSEVENKIKENAEKINNIKGILKDEKELNIELIEKINNTPIKHWLKQMYINKKLSDGDNITMLIDDDFLSLNNKDLEDMVKNIPQYIYDGKIPVVSIDGVPNENGYWSLWEVGINGYNNSFKRIFPLFINKSGVLRIASANMLWDIFLKDDVSIIFERFEDLSEENYNMIFEKAKNIAFDKFEELKKSYFEKCEKDLNRYKYALKLRREAAERIGLDAVKRYRLKEIEKEENELNQKMRDYEKILPVLNPLFIIELL